MRQKKRGRLSFSYAGHLGFVGRQPGQCKCLLCGSSMAARESCKVKEPDLIPFLTFVTRQRNWRAVAARIREKGYPDDELSNVVYRVMNAVGPSGILDMKITQSVAEDILDAFRRRKT